MRKAAADQVETEPGAVDAWVNVAMATVLARVAKLTEWPRHEAIITITFAVAGCLGEYSESRLRLDRSAAEMAAR